jgi:hypothetical protein
MEKKYNELCNIPSDINEHLPTLYKYACECESILELGVRGCVSSWAFLMGQPKLLIMNDITECDVKFFTMMAKRTHTKVKTIWQNDLTITLDKAVDLVFIDTYHVYGQLQRELAKFAPLCNKYIIMHDTEIDKEHGECVRNMWNPKRMVDITGIPLEEHVKGLQPAIDEFLMYHPEWELHEVFTNNNGLTILKRT